MANGNDPENQMEVRSFKALPRDPNQPEHKKPRIFIHRPEEARDDAQAPKQPTSTWEAMKMVRLEDFKQLHKVPCIRDAALPGIGGGVIVTGLRFMAGGAFNNAIFWGYGAFCGIGFVAYRTCRNQRLREKDAIRKAVQVLDQKTTLKETAERDKGMAPAGTEGAVGRPVGAAAEQPPPSDSKHGVPFWKSFKFW